MRTRVLKSLVTISLAAAFTFGTTGCPLPSQELTPWNSGDPNLNNFQTTSRWLVLKCAFNNDPTARVMPSDLPKAITNLDDYIDDFMTLRGIGTGNIIDYFRDVTYGMINLETRVYGWYTAPYPSGSSLSRVERVRQCAEAAPASDDIHFDDYDGIVIVTNKQEDGGAGAIGKTGVTIHDHTYSLGVVVLDSGALWTGFGGHEMGHGLGLVHSYDDTTNVCGSGAQPGEYCDRWDLMSAMITQQFANPNYPAEGPEAGNNTAGFFSGGAGPGLNVPNLLQLNALPSDRVATFTIGSPVQTFTIAALSQAAGNTLPLAIKIVNDKLPSDYYTVEYRQPSGWDQGFGKGFVLVHEYKPGSVPWSILQQGNNGDNGAMTEDTLYSRRDKSFVLFISKIDTTAGTATIRITSFSN